MSQWPINFNKRNVNNILDSWLVKHYLFPFFSSYSNFLWRKTKDKGYVLWNRSEPLDRCCVSSSTHQIVASHKTEFWKVSQHNWMVSQLLHMKRFIHKNNVINTFKNKIENVNTKIELNLFFYRPYFFVRI